jgi:hypothetical protein
LLELREEKVKATEVTVVFNACETLVKRVVRSDDPHLGKSQMHQQCSVLDSGSASFYRIRIIQLKDPDLILI